MKHFIIFSKEELDEIKNGKSVVIKNSLWFGDKASDIYCVSEEWMQEYNSENGNPIELSF